MIKNTNKAYIITGQPGVGKTTYGQKLAKELNATILDSDTITEILVKHSLKLLKKNPDDRDSEFFKDNFREVIYNQVYELAKENIKYNNIVIIAPFTKEISSKDFKNKMEKLLKVEVQIFYLTASLDKIKERLIKRNNPRDKAKLDNWDEYVKYFENLEDIYFEHTLVYTD